MPPSELMPIGAFARRCGLTSSALRFYADSGLLPPAVVDPVSGYRYYDAEQLARATALRRLREIAMPLAGVEAVLAAPAEEASRLVDAHVAKIVGDASAALRKATAVVSSLGGGPGLAIGALKGPVLADAVEQVLTATAHEPGLPVLGGLRLEADPGSLTLTATDRYRLSTRTLVPSTPPGRTWAGTLSGDDLRAAAPDIRRGALVRLEAAPHGVWFRTGGREDRYARLLSEEFPDHRAALASPGAVTTRATFAREPFLRALEEQPGERVALHVADRTVEVRPADDGRPGTALPATTTGTPLLIHFELTTLHPAVSTAIGPDLMLDLRGPDQPVTIRSADRGDLTTLAMPVRHSHPKRPRTR
ncbi:MerR family transcriptional regulator [Streptomyces sp. NPDC058157]|uniref:DNA polymerase III subunit beta family protein n=1 Tax=Streptomyces sp. NPDC058157 TaxID=3346360 RepID=UPI0036DFD4DB